MQCLCRLACGVIVLVRFACRHSAELQKETIEINKSLNALKECFRLRSQGTTYLPLRQNLLTRLLKSALVDEDSLAAVIATVSPAAADTEHSHNTLRHACQVCLDNVCGLVLADWMLRGSYSTCACLFPSRLQMDGQPAPFGGKDVGAKMSFASNKQVCEFVIDAAVFLSCHLLLLGLHD